MADEAETERVTFTIANPRIVNSKSLYALVDVEVQVAGLSFVIVGVQVRHGSGGLSARLPTQSDVNGAWRPVVEMPDELLRPLGNAVREFLAEEGLAERKSILVSTSSRLSPSRRRGRTAVPVSVAMVFGEQGCVSEQSRKLVLSRPPRAQ